VSRVCLGLQRLAIVLGVGGWVTWGRGEGVGNGCGDFFCSTRPLSRPCPHSPCAPCLYVVHPSRRKANKPASSDKPLNRYRRVENCNYVIGLCKAMDLVYVGVPLLRPVQPPLAPPACCQSL
jgi:hypothetical protein